jgi:hypothetical protein
MLQLVKVFYFTFKFKFESIYYKGCFKLYLC